MIEQYQQGGQYPQGFDPGVPLLLHVLQRSFGRLFIRERTRDRLKTAVISDPDITSFKLIVDLKHVAVILDENDRVVCMGICFPSIARAVQKSGGRLTPAALVRLLKAIKRPDVIDLGLIAVEPEYMNRGVATVISAELIKMLRRDNIDHAETNLNLENNFAIQNQWKRFKEVKHKRRRAFVKKISDR